MERETEECKGMGWREKELGENEKGERKRKRRGNGKRRKEALKYQRRHLPVRSIQSLSYSMIEDDDDDDGSGGGGLSRRCDKSQR